MKANKLEVQCTSSSKKTDKKNWNIGANDTPEFSYVENSNDKVQYIQFVNTQKSNNGHLGSALPNLLALIFKLDKFGSRLISSNKF